MLEEVIAGNYFLWYCFGAFAQSYLKLRTIRAKNVFTRQRALRLACLRAQVLKYLLSHVPKCLTCHFLAFLHAHVLTCLACLSTLMPTCLTCSPANVPYAHTCQRAFSNANS